MRSVMALPTDYVQESSIDFSKGKAFLVLLTLAGVPIFVGSGLFFLLLASKISSVMRTSGTFTLDMSNLLEFCVLFLVIACVVMVIHEFIHGIFFQIFTHARPKYGFKGIYAYACAPAWYIPRNQFLLIGLAPLVVITVIGCLLLPFLPLVAVISTILAMTFNVAGAIGDIYVIGLILTKSSACLLRDMGDGIIVYGIRGSTI